MAKILNLTLPIGEAGYLTSTLRKVSRGTPEDDPLKAGALLKYGSSIGHYEAFDGSEAATTGFAGIVVAPQVHRNYDNTIDIVFGEYGDVLIEGTILVKVGAAVVDLTTIVEGGKVFLSADGRVAPTGTDAKEIKRLKFTGNVGHDKGNIPVAEVLVSL